MDAERVVVEILAKVDGFDGKVRQSANAFAGGMKQIESSATRAEGAVGRSMTTIERSAGAARQATRNLGYQISDISTQLSGGASPFLVLAQQGPQVANALDGAKGAVGKFATFLSGPLGAAVLGAVTLLGVFLSKNKETADSVDDLVEKLKKKAEQDRLGAAAQEAFNRTAEGAAISLRKFTDEIDSQNRSLEENIRLVQAKARQDIATVRSGIASQERELSDAKRRLALAEEEVRRAEAGSDAGSSTEAVARLSSARSTLASAKNAVDQLEKSLGRLRSSLAGGERALQSSEFPLIEKAAKDALDPLAQINNRYDAMVKAAERASVGNKKLAASLQETVNGIEAQRKAALDAERDRQRQSKAGPGQFTLADAKQIVAQLGGIPPTSHQLTQGKHAKNSYHYAGQAIDFVPKGGMASLTKDDIRRAFEQGGAKLIELLGPGDKGHSDHFHVAFAKTRRSPEDINDANARAAQAEAARQDRQQGILGSLQERYAAALAKLAQGTEESADAQKAAIEAQRVELDRKLDADAKLDPEIRAKAKELNDATAKLAAEIVDRAEAERQFRIKAERRERDLTVAEALNQQQQEQLQLQSGLARSQAERRDIELRILKLAIEEERLRAQAVIAARDALKAELDKKGVDKLTDADRKALADANAQATIAQGTLSALPGKQSMQTAGILQQTAGPLQQLFNSLPQSAQEISEAFEAIAAHGLDALADSITDVITGSKSLGEAFRGVAQSIIRDIIAMTVKMLIFRAISSAIGFSGGGSIGGGAGAVGSAASGSNVGAALFKASGGAIFGRGSGTSDSIPAWLSNGEYVVKAKAVKALGIPFLDAINKGKLPHFSDGGLVSAISPANIPARGAMTGLTVVQQFTLDARHGITTPELLRHVNTVASEKAAQAGRTAYDASRRALPKQIGNFQKLGTT